MDIDEVKFFIRDIYFTFMDRGSGVSALYLNLPTTKSHQDRGV